MNDPDNPHIPEGSRQLIGDGTFRFDCHSGVACFTRCCHDADMYLYPYDIVRLKLRLGLTSEAFLARHTITAFRDNPYFPHVMLQMSEGPGRPCPFLSANGCTVYEDRPYSCRAYPLEPAIFGGKDGKPFIRCYLARHDHCLGHREPRTWTAGQWMDDQQMNEYNEINARWARVDALLRANPFGEKGIDHPAMKMVYMACFNLDTFRRFVFESSFLSRFDLPQARLEAVRGNESELLLLGFDWVLRILAGQGPLREHDAGR